jgi:hypothetical protein
MDEFLQLTRSYEATIDDVKPKERSVVAKINTWDVDRYKTSILSRGAILDGYRKNPVVLFEHGEDPARGALPIGRNEWIVADDTTIKAKTIFRDDAYSRELFDCYREGWLRGWSVRMVNPEYGPPTAEEIRSRPELKAKDCRLVFRRWEMGEYSAVVVPGNEDTLTILTSRGIFIPDRVRAMTDSCGGMAGGGAALEPVVKDKGNDGDDGKPPGARKRYVKQVGTKWVVFSEDDKHLGEYESEKAANDRLEEIEYFKAKEARGERRASPFIVEGSDGRWWIDEGDRRKLAFPTYQVAEECLALMRSRPTQLPTETVASVLLADIRRGHTEIEQELREWVELYTRGGIGSGK